MNDNIQSNLGSELEAQVVGESWIPGAKHLAEIRKRLKLKKTAAPDFLNHHAAAAEAMVALGQVPYVKVTADGKFVCIFESGGQPAITEPQDTAPHAVTCALHFVLEGKSPVT
jgi:hypothetical protein